MESFYNDVEIIKKYIRTLEEFKKDLSFTNFKKLLEEKKIKIPEKELQNRYNKKIENLSFLIKKYKMNLDNVKNILQKMEKKT